MISRVLKGLGRLVLTTTVLFGVGLFLCSSEVKATNSITAVDDGSGNLKITINSDEISDLKLSRINIENNVSSAYDVMYNDITGDSATDIVIPKADGGTPGTKDIIIPKELILDKTKGRHATDKNIKVTKVDAYFKDVGLNIDNSSPTYSTPSIFEVKLPTAINTSANGETDLGTAVPAFAEFKVGNRDYTGKTAGYGFANESYSVKTNIAAAPLSGKTGLYYENIGVDGSLKAWFAADAGFKAVGEAHTGAVTADTQLAIQYFPKVDAVTIADASYTIHLDATGKLLSTPQAIAYTFTPAENAVTTSKNYALITTKCAFIPEVTEATATSTLKIANIESKYSTSDKKATLTFGTSSGDVLVSDAVAGNGKVGLKLGYIDGGVLKTDNTINAINTGTNTKPLTVYACPTGVGLDNSSSVTTYVKQTETYNLTIVPGGADPNWNYYAKDGKFLTISNVGKSADYVTVSYAGNSPVIKITGKKKGTGVKLQLKLNNVPEKGNQALTSEVTIDVEESTDINEENTEKYINSTCDKNYITVGYKLDLNKLVLDNCRNGAGNKVSGLKNEDIGSIDYNDEDKGKKIGKLTSSTNKDGDEVYTLEGVAEGMVELDVDVDSASLKIKVYVYPKPTATYSSSAHTLKVTIPTKISTAYGDTNTNINAGKGFYLALENGSGEQIADYDKSKYQTIISTLKDYSAEYTVTASDIESLITKAASNGKFSSDTNSVKFKITPMGYKQGTSNEIVTAKDELTVKSDATTVYRVKSSGEGFNESYGYGLDGQTVTLTASPKSGYTFSKWSDNVANNPRSVKVAASGTRDFTAVAKETPAGAAAGGAAGGDNSSLYDDVPKTAESNSAIWLIVFMVFAVMGTAYALYLQLTAATSKHGK